jgi:hypothetical protein
MGTVVAWMLREGISEAKARIREPDTTGIGVRRSRSPQSSFAELTEEH